MSAIPLNATDRGQLSAGSPVRFLAYTAGFAALCLALQAFNGAWNADLARKDEAAHYVNGVMIWAYLTGALGTNPIHFALDFY